MSTHAQQNRQAALAAARFEVLPIRKAAERAAALPAGTTVTVTASPRKGIDATVALAGDLAGNGLHAVPHLAARLFADTAHLSRVLDRIGECGIDEAFVVGGDSPAPVGEFGDALSLLRAIDGLGGTPARIGVAAYPEGHPLISDEALVTALAGKSRYADYLVSQMCFDPATVAAWLGRLRARGITLPVYVGIPGAVEVTKLMKISLRIGIGDSMRFLRKQHGVVSGMLSGYAPDHLVDGLEPYLADPEYGIAGWHLFTFNEVDKTLHWRDGLAQRHEEATA